MDDHSNMDAKRNLSEQCTGFTRFTILNGQESGLHKFKQPKGKIICGQRFGPVLQDQLNEKKSSIGLWRHRSSTTRES